MSTLCTWDIEKGDQEGKTLLDTMRDGDTEGMQHFNGSIEEPLGNIAAIAVALTPTPQRD